MQCPTLRDCDIDPTAKICQRSNLINVSMGRYSYMGAANSLNNVEIGSFCSIASYCAIGGGSHPIEYVSTSPVFLRGDNFFHKNFANLQFEEAEKVVIGNDVWIGEGCFINGGVTIGNGAIVGAHSVITKDVEPYSVVAGAPARLLRLRFDKDTASYLERIQWWNWPEKQIERYSTYFGDPRALIEVLEG